MSDRETDPHAGPPSEDAPPSQAELLRLLRALRHELREIDASRRDEVARILLRALELPTPGGKHRAGEDLRGQLRDLAARHPRLATTIESLAETMSSAGI